MRDGGATMGEPESLPQQESGQPGQHPTCPDAGLGSSLALSDEPVRAGRLFRVTRAALLYRLCFLVLLTAVGVLLLAILVPMGIRSRDWVVLALLAAWTLALLRYWVFMLAMPHSIRCGQDQVLDFRSLFRTVRIPCSEVRELRVSPFYPGYLKLLSSRRRGLLFLSHIDGLHELVGWIRQSNPSVRTRGC